MDSQAESSLLSIAGNYPGDGTGNSIAYMIYCTWSLETDVANCTQCTIGKTRS